MERIDAAGIHQRPVRRTLGISAFGTNAYTADAGEHVVEPHTEEGNGHEELYVLIAGAATFVVDGETIEATPGTLVFLHDPASHREATATEDGTIVMAFGGAPGAAGPVSAWEWRFAASPLAEKGDYEAAYAMAARALEDHPDDPSTQFDLACWAGQAGRLDDAVEHFLRAVEKNPRARVWAADDADLDPIRADPRVVEALREDPGA